MKQVRKAVWLTVLLIVAAVMLSFSSAADGNSVKFNSIPSTVYPYVSCVQSYLRSEHTTPVQKFVPNGILDQHLDVTVGWTFTGSGLKGYTFEYSVNPDFKASVKRELSASETSIALCNLLKAQKYYIRVTAHTESGNVLTNSSFATTDLGPRVLNVGGLYGNFRDIGGFRTANGKVTLQNKIIRGSAADDCSSADACTLTEKGRKFLTEELGIKLEIDLRGSHENCGRTTEPSIEGARYLHIPLTAYTPAFNADQADMYRDVFRAFADEANYPIYFHCVGGADRTGTVAAILEALLGYSYDDIISDYELTSFSRVGLRDKANITPVLDKLKAYGGRTLQENAEKYLLSIGVTKKEINSIKAIMTGVDPENYPFSDVSGSAYYNDAVTWAYDNGIVSGTGGGFFSPNMYCSRAQAIFMIWKSCGSPDVSAVLPFTDIASDAYYRKAVEWAYANEITFGTSADSFSPNLPCSRAEVLTFIWGAEGKPQNEEDEKVFYDVGADNWFYVPVMWAYENGLTYGTSEGEFSPVAAVTRAQVITFIHKY